MAFPREGYIWACECECVEEKQSSPHRQAAARTGRLQRTGCIRLGCEGEERIESATGWRSRDLVNQNDGWKQERYRPRSERRSCKQRIGCEEEKRKRRRGWREGIGSGTYILTMLGPCHLGAQALFGRLPENLGRGGGQWGGRDGGTRGGVRRLDSWEHELKTDRRAN